VRQARRARQARQARPARPARPVPSGGGGGGSTPSDNGAKPGGGVGNDEKLGQTNGNPDSALLLLALRACHATMRPARPSTDAAGVRMRARLKAGQPNEDSEPQP